MTPILSAVRMMIGAENKQQLINLHHKCLSRDIKRIFRSKKNNSEEPQTHFITNQSMKTI